MASADTPIERDGFFDRVTIVDVMHQQWNFQKLLIEAGKIPDLGLLENRRAYIKEQHQAATVELTEILNCIGWKSWADADHIDYEKGMEEVVDLLCFAFNLAMAFGFLDPDLFNAERIAARLGRLWLEKMEKNVQRQIDGKGYKGFGQEER